MGLYVSILLGRTFRKGSLNSKLSKRRYFIGQVVVWDTIYSSHKVGILKGNSCCFVGCSSIVFTLSGSLFSRGEYAKRVVVLRVALACIEGDICVLYSCQTLVSLQVDLRHGISDGHDAYFLVSNTLEVYHFGVFKVTVMSSMLLTCVLQFKIYEILLLCV